MEGRGCSVLGLGTSLLGEHRRHGVVAFWGVPQV